MKLLLDMYRSAPKEQRDKVQLMAAEKKAKSEVTSTPQSALRPLISRAAEADRTVPIGHFLT